MRLRKKWVVGIQFPRGQQWLGHDCLFPCSYIHALWPVGTSFLPYKLPSCSPHPPSDWPWVYGWLELEAQSQTGPEPSIATTLHTDQNFPFQIQIPPCQPPFLGKLCPCLHPGCVVP